MFNKILIANRGEIALRIIRACKELAIKTVAVYSEVDKDALHVKFADQAICIGPAESFKSYLNVPNIISAAEISGAEAIHPGYGFLAENPNFIEVCEACNIKFIGPSPESIKLSGNKAEARKILKKAGIPVLPGSDGKVETLQEAIAVARKIGFPIMIKSAAGGGGKGIRVVRDESTLTKMFVLVQGEANASFGDSELYLEKYVSRPKHIEFQILCDSKGQKIHLGERDCSIQRRHQKLLEESPSFLTPELREEIGKTSLKVAEVLNYVNAGTVEFLLDGGENYYFIEINTRIQVEHPVTEMVTGIDIVKEQIKIAAGEEISCHQEDIKLKGHSIECRIIAEDSVKFIPSAGKITNLNLPAGPGVRVDTAISCNTEVLPFYDSLLAKLIIYGENRSEAIRKMNIALDEFIIEGIKTTIPFHRKVLRDSNFIKGVYYTDFLNKFGL